MGISSKFAIGAGVIGVSALGIWWTAQAQTAPAAAPAAAAATCSKAYAGGQCCTPAMTQHLTKEAIFSACGESDATYLGEKAGKDTCRYVFKSEKDGKSDGKSDGEGFVEVYAPAQKEVPSAPSNPFFAWKKVGKAYITERAMSPKSAPMLLASTGLWMPGAGYFVSVNASTKVCSKTEVARLAKALR